ncbi:hypothetical protein [Sphingobacterium faecale]|nr:hypothetical protein [Sphingobacterium faecale]
MEKYSVDCLLGALTTSTFRYYYGSEAILTGETTHFAKITAARSLGLLGALGSGADTYIQFRNTGNSIITAGTPTYFKLKEAPVSTGINLEVGKLLGITSLVSISGAGYKNATNYKVQTGSPPLACLGWSYNGNENNGILVSNTKTRLLIDPLGEWYAAVIPDENYNSVRLSVTYPNFDLEVLSALSEINVNVYNAFTESSGSTCSTSARYTSPGEATGISLNTGVLGLRLDSLIANPHHAIQDNNSYASYSSGISLSIANTVAQTIYFDHTASANDGVRIKLGFSKGLIDLGLAKLNSINFKAYNMESETPTWEGNLFNLSELLGLNLLNLINIGQDGRGMLDMVFKPGVAFDRIKVEFNAGLLGLGVLGDALRVYNISLVPVAPELLKAGQPDSKTVCERDEAKFSVIATQTGDRPLTYQWQYLEGETWTDISGADLPELTLSNVPLSADGRRYRAAITGGNQSCPQTIYSADAVLNVTLKPGKPHVTITDIIN